MNIGKRIRRLRGKAGLSQGAVAQLSGISQGYLSQLEGDEVKNPSWSIVTQLARVFGVSAMELTGDEEPDVTLHPTLRRLLVDMPLPTQGALAELVEVIRAD